MLRARQVSRSLEGAADERKDNQSMRETATSKSKARTNGRLNGHLTSSNSSNGLPFALRNSAIQGKGIVAARRIRKNQRLIEYLGEIITNEEADKRYDDEGMSRHHTFLFTLDDKRVIDGSRNGNVARYINHSCQPNCEAVEEDGGIWIYAFRNIQPGAELTYDYAFEHVGVLTEKDRAMYPCRCGSPKCRGTILKVKRKRRTRRKMKKAG